jgi:hypothetical protein
MRTVVLALAGLGAASAFAPHGLGLLSFDIRLPSYTCCALLFAFPVYQHAASEPLEFQAQ